MFTRCIYINKWLLSGLVGHLHHEINPKLASANSPSIAKPRRMLNTRDFGLMDFDGMLAVDSRRLEPCERSDRNNVMGDVYYQTCWWHNPNAVHLSKAINRVWISEYLIKKNVISALKIKIMQLHKLCFRFMSWKYISIPKKRYSIYSNSFAPLKEIYYYSPSLG